MSLLFLTLTTVLGLAMVVAFRIHEEKMTQLFLGILLGIVLMTSLTYVGTAIVSLRISMIIMSLLAIAIITFLSFHTPWWQTLRAANTDWIALSLFVPLFLLSAIISPKLLIARPDGLYTGIINAYGDVAWHVSNITAFEQGQSFIPENPIFAHHRLNYPFLANFFSAMLVTTGMSLATSVTLPAVVLIPLFLSLLYAFVRDITSDRLGAVVATVLFLFGGATLGITRFWGDWQGSGQTLWYFLMNLPDRDFSGVGTDMQGFHFLNPITTLLLPQRPLLFGFPIAISILLLIHRHTKKAFFVAGLLAGMLPLFHAHSVLALIPAIIGLFLMRPSWNWLFFFIPAAVVGLPEVMYHAVAESEPGSFFRWGPGWMADSVFPIYWLKNTGFLIPLTIIGFFLPAPRVLKILSAAGLFLFALANLFLFAPWVWDNFKILVYWFLLCLPLCAWVLVRWGRSRNVLLVSTAVLIILIQISAAGLDIWKLTLPSATTWKEWDASAIAIADAMKESLPPQTTIATAAIHNSPVFLSGRFAYLGYGAHVWSHGGNPSEQEKALELFYTGFRDNLPADFPNYVLVGPDEHLKYGPTRIDPSWLIVTKTELHTVYNIHP